MIHLLHHQVKIPGQRVARAAAWEADSAADASPHRWGGGRKVLRHRWKRREEWWSASG